MRQWKAGGHSGAAIARLRRQMVAALESHLMQGEPPRPPLAGVMLWQSFIALSELRTFGEAGPDPIRPGDIEAWARLHGRHLPPHHVTIITALDLTWLKWARTPEKDRVVGVMTAERFDALFGG